MRSEVRQEPKRRALSVKAKVEQMKSYAREGTGRNTLPGQ